MFKHLSKYNLCILLATIILGCKAKQEIYYSLQDVVPDDSSNQDTNIFEKEWGTDNLEKLKNTENFELLSISNVIDKNTNEFIGTKSTTKILSYDSDDVEKIKRILKESANYHKNDSINQKFDVHYKLVGFPTERNLTILIDTVLSKIGIIDISGISIKQFDTQKLNMILQSSKQK